MRSSWLRIRRSGRLRCWGITRRAIWTLDSTSCLPRWPAKSPRTRRLCVPMLRLSLEQPPRNDLVLRRGRRITWLTYVLPVKPSMTNAAFERLILGIASCTGIESYIWLRDMAECSQETHQNHAVRPPKRFWQTPAPRTSSSVRGVEPPTKQNPCWVAERRRRFYYGAAVLSTRASAGQTGQREPPGGHGIHRFPRYPGLIYRRRRRLDQPSRPFFTRLGVTSGGDRRAAAFPRREVRRRQRPPRSATLCRVVFVRPSPDG